MKFSRFTRFGIIFTAVHFIILCLFMFVALLWYGHGGSGAPSTFIEKTFKVALQVWTLGNLPTFLSSPIFGFALSYVLVVLNQKHAETKGV